MSRGAGAKKSASPRQQSTREFIKSALGSTEREPGWEYGQVLPVRARKNEEGKMEREWGLGYSNTAKGMLDAITLPRRAFEGEEVSPEQAMEMAMNITAPGVATARYAPGVLNMPIVYHGTPHRFAPTPDNPLGEFDASYIGTGEGAQMRGHGIYLAEAKDVADQYANMPKFKLGVVENAQELGNNAKSFVERVEKFGSVEKAKVEAQELLREMQKQNIFPAIQQQLANEIDVANKLGKKIKVKATGIEPQVYKADLPDEMVDRMVDWDKPVHLQTPKVREALQSIIDETLGQGVFSELIRSNPDFKDLQDNALESLTNAEISEALRQRGIPGIKYLDQGSRDKGEGTRNFVLFPGEEKKAKILKRD